MTFEGTWIPDRVRDDIQGAWILDRVWDDIQGRLSPRTKIRVHDLALGQRI
jgi:hypothetical protein